MCSRACSRSVHRVRRRHHRGQHFILRCHTILAHAVSVYPERSSDVAVAEHRLHRLYVRPLPHKEARQAMSEVMEPEARTFSPSLSTPALTAAGRRYIKVRRQSCTSGSADQEICYGGVARIRNADQIIPANQASNDLNLASGRAAIGEHGRSCAGEQSGRSAFRQSLCGGHSHAARDHHRGS